VEFFGQQRGNALHLASHAAASARFRTRDIVLEPYNEIPLTFENLSAYYRSLSSKMRSNIGRQTRRLFSDGDAELVLADGPQATSAWFDAYCDLDGRSWKRGTDASIQRHARRVQFYREIAAARGGLDPSFIGVVLGGALIAGLLVGSNQTASPGFHGAWCLEMAYDQSQAELGPGQLLLLLAVAEAIRRGDRHLSFMQNFSYYKHRWKADAIEVVSVQLIRRASLQNVRASLGDFKKRWFGRRGQPATEPRTHHDANRAANKRAAAAPQGQEHSRSLASSALGFTGSGVRRLNREQARAYLPFDLG
jgi:CelD/BcsL family acetyltransferase involved in cellulose biosynthesis